MSIRPKAALMAGVALLAITQIASSQDSLTVSASPLESLAAGITQRAPATVVPANVAVIAAEIDGVVSEVAFDVAQTAERGEVLARIDATDLTLSLRLAEANLAAVEARIELAKRRALRARELSERNFASLDDVAARETDLAAMRADRQAQQVRVDQAKRELEKTTLVAPFTGTVIERLGQQGGYVTRGTPLMRLSQVSDPTVQAQLDPSQAISIATSRSISFEGPGGSWPVALSALSPVVDERSRTTPARLVFAQSAAPAGTSGYLIWNSEEPRVPARFVVKRDGQLGVFVLEGQTARFLALPQAQEGRPASVPLATDALIVTDGRHRLNDGDRVSVTP